MLHSAERHFSIKLESWNKDQATDLVYEIISKSEAAFSKENFWPTHPLDQGVDAIPHPMMYFGISGAAWGLRQLRNQFC